MAKPPSDDAVGRGQWRRIAATVEPLKWAAGRAVALNPAKTKPGKDNRLAELLSASMGDVLKRGPAPAATGSSALTQGRGDAAGKRARSAGQLDGTWERQLRGGRVEPDLTIDLHGHSLASAHTHLGRMLDRAEAAGTRIILLIAGRARGPDEAPRGAIRRELESWLAHSRHASRIAAVRTAHPRHGGTGALYLVLRRPTPAR